MTEEEKLARYSDWLENELAEKVVTLEAVIRRYHDWHLKNGGDDDGYLESGLYEDACAAVPGLAQIGKK